MLMLQGVCCFPPDGHTDRGLTKPLTGPLGPPASLDCGTGLISQGSVGPLPSGAGGLGREKQVMFSHLWGRSLLTPGWLSAWGGQ